MTRPVFLPTLSTLTLLRRRLAYRNFEVWSWRVLWLSWLVVQALSWK